MRPVNSGFYNLCCKLIFFIFCSPTLRGCYQKTYSFILFGLNSCDGPICEVIPPETCSVNYFLGKTLCTWPSYILRRFSIVKSIRNFHFSPFMNYALNVLNMPILEHVIFTWLYFYISLFTCNKLLKTDWHMVKYLSCLS